MFSKCEIHQNILKVEYVWNFVVIQSGQRSDIQHSVLYADETRRRTIPPVIGWMYKVPEISEKDLPNSNSLMCFAEFATYESENGNPI